MNDIRVSNYERVIQRLRHIASACVIVREDVESVVVKIEALQQEQADLIEIDPERQKREIQVQKDLVAIVQKLPKGDALSCLGVNQTIADVMAIIMT